MGFNCELSEPPLESVGPIDEIQMANSFNGSHIMTPLGAWNTVETH